MNPYKDGKLETNESAKDAEPFSIILVIKLNEAVIKPISIVLAALADVIGEMLFTFIVLSTFDMIAGFTSTPLSIILVTILNDEETFVTSVKLPLLVDINWVTSVTLIFPSVFVVNVGEFNLSFWTIALDNAFA